MSETGVGGSVQVKKRFGYIFAFVLTWFFSSNLCFPMVSGLAMFKVGTISNKRVSILSDLHVRC